MNSDVLFIQPPISICPEDRRRHPRLCALSQVAWAGANWAAGGWDCRKAGSGRKQRFRKVWSKLSEQIFLLVSGGSLPLLPVGIWIRMEWYLCHTFGNRRQDEDGKPRCGAVAILLVSVIAVIAAVGKGIKDSSDAALP
jgi:hypothetical protein